MLMKENVCVYIYIYMYVCITESFCFTVDINTSIKFKKKIKPTLNLKVTGWVAHTNMLNLAKPQTNSKPELGTKSSVRAFLIKLVEVKAWCQNQNVLIETQIRLVSGASFCHLHMTSTCTKGFCSATRHSLTKERQSSTCGVHLPFKAKINKRATCTSFIR